MNYNKKIVFVVGPTASGKTCISLALAKDYDGEIISADSMQVYRGMDIGTDKISPLERKDIPHHLLDMKDPSEEFSVFDFREEALVHINKIHQRGHLPIVVGGSGLYIKALLDGLAPYPARSKKIREELKARIEQSGLEALYKELQQIDPMAAQTIHPHDERRIIRALEVFQQIHVPPSIVAEKRDSLTSMEYSFILIGLHCDREQLYSRVNERVDCMIEKGLVDEVSHIQNCLSMTTAHAVGYKEIVEYLHGKISLPVAIEKIKRNSRHLVKKQFTWFRKDKRVQWIHCEQNEETPSAVEKIKNILIPFLEST